MKRRGFLSALSALLALPFVPRKETPRRVTVEEFKTYLGRPYIRNDAGLSQLIDRAYRLARKPPQ